jgi:predicted DNA-binding transcriptional regulator AlpA
MDMNMPSNAYSIEEFCKSHRISRGTFYNLLKAGHAPTIMKVGARTLVSAEAAAEWRRKMEAASAQCAA